MAAVGGNALPTPAGGPKPSAPAERRGWLKKKSPDGFMGIHLWQSRYVTVTNSEIRYYRDMPSVKAEPGMS